MEQRQNMSVSTRGVVHYERVSNVSWKIISITDYIFSFVDFDLIFEDY